MREGERRVTEGRGKEEGRGGGSEGAKEVHRERRKYTHRQSQYTSK